jgi:hypothetical protein
MTGFASGSDEGKRERWITVIRLRTHKDHAEVMFVESARIYRLLRDNPVYEETLCKLRAVSGSGRRVRVRFDKPNGEIIERVD